MLMNPVKFWVSATLTNPTYGIIIVVGNAATIIDDFDRFDAIILNSHIYFQLVRL
jgi:hypothetical protein